MKNESYEKEMEKKGKSDVRGGGYKEERGQEEKGWRNSRMEEVEIRERWTSFKDR